MNESIDIQPVDARDDTPLKELFADGGIHIRLIRISKNRVRVAIEAPTALKISRGPRVDNDGSAGSEGTRRHHQE